MTDHRDAGPLALGPAQDELEQRVREAVGRAGELRRPVLASLSIEVAADLDVAACVFANRAAEERYFIWEQPENDDLALGGLGAAWTIDSVEADRRFDDAAAGCGELTREAVIDRELSAPGAGPIWVGGFAFDGRGGTAPEWASLPSTLLFLPEISLARRGRRVTATLNVICRPGEEPKALCRTATSRLAGLSAGPLPLADPDPLGGYEMSSVVAPADYLQALGEARNRIREGVVEKLVLAREVRVDARTPFRPAAVFGGLRAAYPSCYCFCVGTPDVAFVGASPELLVRREGSRVSAVALAGSARRSADPAIDEHLGERLLRNTKDLAEHRIVARRIERALEPVSIWVTAAEKPALIKVANIQHLATPVRAQLAEPRSAIELAGVLHPTPAVGGEPWERAERVLRDLEGLDRGWYAGAVGWMDATGDGEFCVGLRCALLEGRTAHCYAGVGVVTDSDPESELAETEVKLQALLDVLTCA